MKRGFLSPFSIVMLIILFLLLGVGVPLICYYEDQMDIACINEGFKEFRNTDNANIYDFCEDNNGNLHYIKLIPIEGFMKYQAKEISVGDVRVKEGPNGQ